MKFTERDVELRLQLGDAPELNLRVRPQRFDRLLQVLDRLAAGSQPGLSSRPGRTGLAAGATGPARPGFASWAALS
jgi:hypothetical protein